MIAWLLLKQRRKYLYIALVIVVLDMLIGPLIIAWELKLLKELWDER